MPNDFSVIGFGDDLNYCHASFPALTSISYPAQNAGLQAAELLDLQLKKQTLPQQISRLPIQILHPRESTDFIAIEDKETLQLIRWIRLHAPQQMIQVNALEKQSNLSLSSIKTRFRKHLGHGPKEEITRVRLQHLQHLLRDPTLSLNKITQVMGFSSPHEMSRFFFRETGQRPTVFRELQS